MDKVSIIIPVYNSALYLNDCLSSVCGQTYTNLEIILVNDGSTDNSAELCQRFAAQDSRISIIHQNNQGVSTARNAGKKQATGDYLLFVDSDDRMCPSMIERMVTVAQTHQSDVVVCGIQFFQESCRITLPMSTGPIQSYSSQDALRLFLRNQVFELGAWNKLIRADIAQELFFEPNRRSNEDKFFCFQLFTRAKTVILLQEPLYCYRANDASASHRSFDDRWFDNHYFAEKIYSLIKEQCPVLEREARYQLFLSDYHLLRLICREGAEQLYPAETTAIRSNLLSISIVDIILMIKKSTLLMLLLVRFQMPLFCSYMRKQGNQHKG